MATANALCTLTGYCLTKKTCYSPFARTPYNPLSMQMRIKFIIFSDSDAASGFQI